MVRDRFPLKHQKQGRTQRIHAARGVKQGCRASPTFMALFCYRLDEKYGAGWCQSHLSPMQMIRMLPGSFPRSPGTHIVGSWAIDSISLCRDPRTGTQYRGNWASRIFDFEGARTQIIVFLLKCYDINGIWALKPFFYLGPWTLI